MTIISGLMLFFRLLCWGGAFTLFWSLGVSSHRSTQFWIGILMVFLGCLCESVGIGAAIAGEIKSAQARANRP